MRYIDVEGLATSSGANVRKSAASPSMIAIIGCRTCVSYSSRRALNHSRRLLRFSPRRNFSVSGVKRGAELAIAASVSAGPLLRGLGLRHPLLHLSCDVRNEADHPLHRHELSAMVHLV